jgi:hypothetical protein
MGTPPPPRRDSSLMPMRLGMLCPLQVSPSGKEACNICSQEHNDNLGMKVEHVELSSHGKIRHY